jgi:hypothetical protein
MCLNTLSATSSSTDVTQGKAQGGNLPVWLAKLQVTCAMILVSSSAMDDLIKIDHRAFTRHTREQ